MSDTRIRPCQVLLKDIVKSSRIALATGIEEVYAQMLGCTGAQMASVVEKIKTFGKNETEIPKNIEEESSDSECMIVDIEPAPAPSKSGGKKTPKKQAPEQPMTFSSPSDLPLKRMTERQLIIETAKQSPLVTNTPIRSEDIQHQVKEEVTRRPGEVVEPIKKESSTNDQQVKAKSTPQSLTKKTIPRQPSSSQCAQAVNGESKVKTLSSKRPNLTPKPVIVKEKGVSETTANPISKKAISVPPVLGGKKPASSPAVSQSTTSDLTMKLKKAIVPKGGVSNWLPSLQPAKSDSLTNTLVSERKATGETSTIENGVANQQSNSVSDSLALFQFGDGSTDNIFSLLSPNGSSEVPSTSEPVKSVDDLSSKKKKIRLSTESLSGDVFHNEAIDLPETQVESEKPSVQPSSSSSLLHGAKKHKIAATDKTNHSSAEKKQKPSVTNEDDIDEGADDDGLPDDPVLLKQKIGKKKEIIAGLKRKLKSEREKNTAKDNEIKELKEALKVLETELSTVRGKCELLLAELEQQSHRSIDAKSVTYANFECQCVFIPAGEDTAVVRDEVKKHEEKISDLLFVVEQLNNDIEKQSEKLSASSSKVNVLADEKNELERELGSNRKLLEEAEKKCSAAIGSCESFKHEIAGLHRSVAKLNQCVKDREAKIAELSAATSKQPNEAVGELSVDESELVKQLKSQLAKARRECVERGEMVNELKQELALAIHRSSSGMEEDLTDALSKIDRYESEKAFLNTRKCQLESENDVLKMQLENLKEELLRVVLNRNVAIETLKQIARNKKENQTTEPAGICWN